MDINGTYRGFSPTDESGVGFGEIEFVITDKQVKFKFATGLEVQKDGASRSGLQEMTTDEVVACFNDEAAAAGVVGYTFGPDCATFLFIPETTDAPDAPQVILLRFVSDEIDSIFGPTVLYTPDQVQAGKFDAAIASIDELTNDPGVVPRIALDGRRG